MCYSTCSEQKLPILAVFTWFLILGKIQDGHTSQASNSATTHKCRPSTKFRQEKGFVS